jgi:pyruvate formate lyase activating enzyme
MSKQLVRKDALKDVKNKHEATKYFDILDDKRVRCRLCPNDCMIVQGKSGLCRTRVNIDGKLYSTVYGYPCGLHIDPIEKKPLYHFYPGQKILSFGTFGCNLFCKGCQNYDMTRVDASGADSDKQMNNLKYYSPEDIVDMALENDIRLIAYTYNEPTIFFEYMIDIARIARKKGIKNVIVSNGYINPGPLKELCKYIDAANIDLKGITEKFYMDYSKTRLKPVLETIKTLHEYGIWLELTNLVIPGLNDSHKDMKELCEWVKNNIGTKTPLHFSRFYPNYDASDIPPTNPKKLEDAKKIAEGSGIEYVYIGNLGFLDTTCCSNCRSVLIERNYYGVNIKGLTKDNKCTKCGNVLAGIF